MCIVLLMQRIIWMVYIYLNMHVVFRNTCVCALKKQTTVLISKGVLHDQRIKSNSLCETPPVMLVEEGSANRQICELVIDVDHQAPKNRGINLG